MALIACPDCGNQISDLAPTCPRCGRPAEPLAPVSTLAPQHVEPVPETFTFRCPGCSVTLRAAKGTTLTSCTSCGEGIMWVRCSTTGWIGPVLTKWPQFTHAGCKVKHPAVPPPNPHMVCPHCQTIGFVATTQVKVKRGISGGKATGAILTGGFSLLATGLARQDVLTQATCGKCGMQWIL